jgi:hypothetical protein
VLIIGLIFNWVIGRRHFITVLSGLTAVQRIWRRGVWSRLFDAVLTSTLNPPSWSQMPEVIMLAQTR